MLLRLLVSSLNRVAPYRLVAGDSARAATQSVGSLGAPTVFDHHVHASSVHRAQLVHDKVAFILASSVRMHKFEYVG
jgi:hypothetical protein